MGHVPPFPQKKKKTQRLSIRHIKIHGVGWDMFYLSAHGHAEGKGEDMRTHGDGDRVQWGMCCRPVTDMGMEMGWGWVCGNFLHKVNTNEKHKM